VFAVVSLGIGDQIDQSTPTAAKSDHLVTFPAGTHSHCPNCRVQPGDITPSSEYSNAAFMRRQDPNLLKLKLRYN